MRKWRLKSCPRCKGDLYLEKDIYGWYEQCLQCGYVKDLDPIYEVKLTGKEMPGKWDRDAEKPRKSKNNKARRVDKRLAGASLKGKQ